MPKSVDKKPILKQESSPSSASLRTTLKQDAQARLTNHKRIRTAFILLTFAILVGLLRYKISTNLDDFTVNNNKLEQQPTNGHTKQTIDETLKSMLNIESRIRINRDLNVAVGFGSCVDIFVQGKNLIFDSNPAPKVPSHHQNIRNQQDLNELLSYFFVAGAAAERYINNKTFFQELVDKAYVVDNSRWIIGGNAHVMASRFITEGVQKVFLGSQYSKKSFDQFNNKLSISGPSVETDDVHICIEYSSNERWDNLVAPRANRLVIHSDFHNPSFKSIDNFIERLQTNKNLDLIVIGGLQLMDNIPIPIEERHEKLSKLSLLLGRLPPKKPKIHLELASFTEEALLKSISDLIIPHVDSLGMNEQELPTLLNFLSDDGVKIRSEAYARVATTLDQMRQLYQILYSKTGQRLDRIHAHTLAFQAIMTKVGSSWKNTLTSSVKAALMAHRYTCGNHEIDMAKAKLIMDESYTTSKQGSRRKIPFNPKHPVNCWQEDILVDSEGISATSPPGKQISTKIETIEICVAPVLVCTKVKQTAGAGDNISATGLIYQL